MRASVGVRMGPVYVGSGNLLRRKRRRSRHPSPNRRAVWAIVTVTVVLSVGLRIAPPWGAIVTGTLAIGALIAWALRGAPLRKPPTA